MPNNDNCNKNIDGQTSLPTKITRIILISIFDRVADYLSEEFNYYCKEIPSDFHYGIAEAFEFLWKSVIYGDFADYDCDDVISFDEIVESLCLDKSPKNVDELEEMANELDTKLWFYDYLQWCEYYVREHETANPNNTLCSTKWKNFKLEQAEHNYKKYGKENLYIRDFFEFGYLYGKVIAFNRGLYYLDEYIY